MNCPDWSQDHQLSVLAATVCGNCLAASQALTLGPGVRRLP